MDEIYKSDSGQRLTQDSARYKQESNSRFKQNSGSRINNILDSYSEYPLSVRNDGSVNINKSSELKNHIEHSKPNKDQIDPSTNKSSPTRLKSSKLIVEESEHYSTGKGLDTMQSLGDDLN